jgi:hypothetical protein
MSGSSKISKEVLDYFQKSEKNRVAPASPYFEDRGSFMEDEIEEEYDLSWNAIRIVAGANMASEKEIKKDIQYLDRIIGTGYYDDPDGDDLLKHVRQYLNSKLERK